MRAVVALLLISASAHAGEYAWPTTEGAYVSAHYDNAASGLLDWECGTHTYDGHRGTDIAGLARNTPVYAGAGGTVIRRYDGFGDGYYGNWDGGGFGNHIAVYHPDGHTTIYGHLNAYSGLPQIGEEIECLQAVGGVGTSGNSTGLHLHFEVRVGTDGVNYYSGAAEDPYAGACSGPVSYWTEQNGGTPLRTCSDGTVYVGDFCDGKMDGAWCDGDDLVICDAGDEASRDLCDDGCVSMPLGTPDECATPSTTPGTTTTPTTPTTPEFCDGLMNGLWCDGDDLVYCSNDVETSRETCDHGCTSMPLGTPDECAPAPTTPGFCVGLLDGWWCDGDDLVWCDNDVVTSRETCEWGCQSNPLGYHDECYADPSCVGLLDGWWCDGDDLLYCLADEVISRDTCPNGCVSMPLGTPDECAP